MAPDTEEITINKQLATTVLLTLFLVSTPLAYQIQGYITDQQQTPVPSATVTIQGQNITATDTTTTYGQYTLGETNNNTFLGNGTYNLTITQENITEKTTQIEINGENKDKNIEVTKTTDTTNDTIETSNAPFHKDQWIYDSDKLVINVKGIKYVAIMRKIDTIVTFDIYERGNKVNQGRLAKGEKLQLPETNITILETYPASSRAEMRIETTDPDTRINIGKKGKITVYPSTKNYILSSLDKRKQTITYTNKYDREIKIHGISLETVTEGFKLESTSGDTLKPDQELTATLTINPRKLTTGQHTQQIQLTYTIRDQKLKTNSKIKIEIPESTMTQLATKEGGLNITAPDTAIQGEWITIKITGVTEKDAISVTDPVQGMQINPSSKQITHGTWAAQFKFNKPGTYNIPFGFYGTFFDSADIDIANIEDTNFTFNPELEPGTESDIVTKLKGEEINMKTKVNGNRTNTITPEYGETYKVCGEYKDEETCENVEVGEKHLTVQGISTLKPGEEINPTQLTVQNQQEETITNYTVYLDNQEITQPTKIPANSKIKVKAEDYNSYTRTIHGEENKGFLQGITHTLTKPLHLTLIAAAIGILILAYIIKKKKPPKSGFNTTTQDTTGWGERPQATSDQEGLGGNQ